MINSFKHKGLEIFFKTENKKGIIPSHANKIGRMLDRLEGSIRPDDMNLPGYDYHALKGEEKGKWAVSVNGNWRIVFEFEGENAIKVDYLDYH